MGKMLAVRFPADLLSAVRQFARQDGKTVSAWLRDLVVAEARRPQRQRPVDCSEYPQSRTVSSGAGRCRVEFGVSPAPVSRTGYW